jgi:hypothetical protein
MTADQLQGFHRECPPLFQRREQHTWYVPCLYGQFSDLERKTIEPTIKLAHLTAMHWRVGTTLEAVKDEVGLLHFETRTCKVGSSYASVIPGKLILAARSLPVSKRPALTTAKAWQLVAHAIPDEVIGLPDLSVIMHYRRSRNHAPFRSVTSVPIYACKNETRIIAKARYPSNTRIFAVRLGMIEIPQGEI